MIYLDSAATSLWHPKEAEERMIQALHGCGNAGRGAHDATLDAGRIVFDVKGEARSKMTVDDLLEKFRENAGKALDNDRILLSKVEANN